jgi:hypothetical protein
MFCLARVPQRKIEKGFSLPSQVGPKNKKLNKNPMFSL